MKCATSSQFKGVTWIPSRSKWQAQIGISGRQTYIGKFDCEHAAGHAYNKAAIEIYGEFAVLNPVGVEK